MSLNQLIIDEARQTVARLGREMSIAQRALENALDAQDSELMVELLHEVNR